MTEQPLPADDGSRELVVVRAEDAGLKHVSVVGDTYTILINGKQTAGRYALIDMYIPPNGGPPQHRHDFEEMFSVLEGEVELTFRGNKQTAAAGVTVNIPANAPHGFKNVSPKPARLLCMVSPAGEEDFFLEVGDLVDGRTSPPPVLSEAAKKERGEQAMRLMAKYRNEIVK